MANRPTDAQIARQDADRAHTSRLPDSATAAARRASRAARATDLPLDHRAAQLAHVSAASCLAVTGQGSYRAEEATARQLAHWAAARWHQHRAEASRCTRPRSQRWLASVAEDGRRMARLAAERAQGR